MITAIYWPDDFTEVSLTEKAVKILTRNYKLAYNRVYKITTELMITSDNWRSKLPEKNPTQPLQACR